MEKKPRQCCCWFIHRFFKRSVCCWNFNSKINEVFQINFWIDASQHYFNSMCQPIPTGLFTHLDLDSETGWLTPPQNKTRSLENLVMSHFQGTISECKYESFSTTSREIKNGCFTGARFFCSLQHCFRSNGPTLSSFPCHDVRPSLTEEDVKRESRKRELDEFRPNSILKKPSLAMKILSLSSGDCKAQLLLLNKLL